MTIKKWCTHSIHNSFILTPFFEKTSFDSSWLSKLQVSFLPFTEWMFKLFQESLSTDIYFHMIHLLTVKIVIHLLPNSVMMMMSCSLCLSRCTCTACHGKYTTLYTHLFPSSSCIWRIKWKEDHEKVVYVYSNAYLYSYFYILRKNYASEKLCLGCRKGEPAEGILFISFRVTRK